MDDEDDEPHVPTPTSSPTELALRVMRKPASAKRSAVKPVVTSSQPPKLVRQNAFQKERR